MKSGGEGGEGRGGPEFREQEGRGERSGSVTLDEN